MGAFARVFYRRQVIVNLHNGNAIQGVLFKQVGPLLVLKNASLLEGRAEPLPLDGETVVERSQVVFIQAP